MTISEELEFAVANPNKVSNLEDLKKRALEEIELCRSQKAQVSYPLYLEGLLEQLKPLNVIKREIFSSLSEDN